MLYIRFVCVIYVLINLDKAFVCSVPACDRALRPISSLRTRKAEKEGETSDIYCYGPILKAVQDARLFEDSKTFVDMNIKTSPSEIEHQFSRMIETYNGSIPRGRIQEFVKSNFDGPGKEFEVWIPEDQPRLPNFINNIRDPLLSDFGWNMCRTWRDLGRKIKRDVKKNSDKSSLIYLPEPFIVPGGRFRETYYWDSYWVIKGLLVCEMTQTVRGMLLNFVHLIKTFTSTQQLRSHTDENNTNLTSYGFIPNGGRIYYTRRSQPPLFIAMVQDYFQATNNITFVQEIIDVMDQEYQFWAKNRSITIEKEGRIYAMNRYASSITHPRPESFTEDEETVLCVPKEKREELHSNLASAAESGWDFSSRWFSRDVGQNLTLETTQTENIIPVDLNSILCNNERILSSFYEMLGNVSRKNYYQQLHQKRMKAVDDIFWNDSAGTWFDYSIKTKESRKFFYQSNIFPLYFACTENVKMKEEKILQYIQRKKAIYSGGVPTSFVSTAQQWDFPNAWPPLQHVWVKALKKSGNLNLRSIAEELSEKWVRSNWLGWKRTRNMFEKYAADNPGTRGGGGEYNVQEGFGWTNGVILDFLKHYGSTLNVMSSGNFSYCIDSACHSSCDANVASAAILSRSNIVVTLMFLNALKTVI